MRETYKKREEQRLKRENEDMEINYTFKPQISNSNTSNEISKRHEDISNNMVRNVNERLYSNNNN